MQRARCAAVPVAYMHQETALPLAAMPCQDSPYSVVVPQIAEAAMLCAGQGPSCRACAGARWAHTHTHTFHRHLNLISTLVHHAIHHPIHHLIQSMCVLQQLQEGTLAFYAFAQQHL